MTQGDHLPGTALLEFPGDGVAIHLDAEPSQAEVQGKGTGFQPDGRRDVSIDAMALEPAKIVTDTLPDTETAIPMDRQITTEELDHLCRAE
jgi:hypothetical protein